MSFAYGDDNSDRRNKPFVVPILIVLNALAFLLQLSAWEQSIMGWSLVPYEITHRVDLVGEEEVKREGKSVTVTYSPAPVSPYLALLTSMFLHGSFGHIFGNMWYLWVFGDQIEDRLGRLRFVIFYLVCGFIASAGYILVYPDSKIPTLGASGAIAGVMGAYLVLHPCKRVNVILFYSAYEWPAWAFHGLWFLLQTIGQFGILGDGIAYLAHVSGFIAGVVGMVGYIRFTQHRWPEWPRKTSSYSTRSSPLPKEA